MVPATEAHARAIAANVREADRIELWAASRADPLAAMLQGMKSTSEPLTAIYDGEPCAMFGVWPYSVLSGMGAAWMIGSNVLNRHGAQRELLRISAPVVEYWGEQFPSLLYNFVDARNTSAIRWLRWLGFKFGDPIPYGVDRLPFIPFFRSED